MAANIPEGRLNRVFSRQLRQFFWRGAGSWLLSDLPFGWLDGGCLIAGEGLLRWMRAAPDGCDAHLALVVRAGGVADHVVVGWGDLALDADGVATKKGLLQRWARRERLVSPQLIAFEDWRLQAAEIPHNPLVSGQLCAHLHDTFGAFRLDLVWCPVEGC